MNKAALTKNEIYNKLVGLSEKELDAIADFVDFVRHKKKVGPKKIIKLQGIIEGQSIDLGDLEQFKKQTWNHLEQEFADE